MNDIYVIVYFFIREEGGSVREKKIGWMFDNNIQILSPILPLFCVLTYCGDSFGSYISIIITKSGTDLANAFQLGV